MVSAEIHKVVELELRLESKPFERTHRAHNKNEWVITVKWVQSGEFF